MESLCDCNDITSNEDVQLYTYLQHVNRKIQSNNTNNATKGLQVSQNNKTLQVLLEHYKKSPSITANFILNSTQFKNITTFKWRYDIRGYNSNESVVIVFIQETYKGVATSGGSSFTLLIRSKNTMDFCPVMDLFNGTYIAKCPVHEEGSTITAECHFVNFMAFTKSKKPKAQKLFQEQADKYLENKTEHRIFSNLENCTKFVSKHPQRGWWVKVNNRWRWFTGRCLVPIVNTKTLSKCVSSYKRVSILICW